MGQQALVGRLLPLPWPPSHCQPCHPENRTLESIDSLTCVRQMVILCEYASPLVLLRVVLQQPVVAFESLSRACDLQKLVKNGAGSMVLDFFVRNELVTAISQCQRDLYGCVRSENLISEWMVG